ncbi:MAG: hypothetical protein EPO07_14505 [Verrucomicrobia bacterium]|nr:MAG: hypothetical protein EPO07_14505 [Verrucomicrobiota bacterium]
MNLQTQSRRRWLGALCVLAALAMLLVEEFALKTALSGRNALIYWLVCLAFTLAAIVFALADARAVSRDAYESQRTLLESTLKEIEERKRERK